MLAILDSLFHKVVNTTNISIGWRVWGGGVMPSLTSQFCSDSQPAVCLAGKVGAINRPPKHPWMPDRTVNEASVKADH